VQLNNRYFDAVPVNSSLLRNNFCHIAGQKTLQGGIGISMAVIEEVTLAAGTSQMRERC
jgi:hypothetical protein